MDCSTVYSTNHGFYAPVEYGFDTPMEYGYNAPIEYGFNGLFNDAK
jgi:hypothetical protein